MGGTIEKRLKDYKGYQVWKITDNKGLHNETTTYMLNDQDGDNIDCFTSLAALKKFVDILASEKICLFAKQPVFPLLL